MNMSQPLPATSFEALTLRFITAAKQALAAEHDESLAQGLKWLGRPEAQVDFMLGYSFEHYIRHTYRDGGRACFSVPRTEDAIRQARKIERGHFRFSLSR